ncbi:MAG: cytochrome c oxidase subunit II [Acetobacterales bacterium]
MTAVRHAFRLLTLCFGLLAAPAAMAAGPQPWELGFQQAVTPVMESITSLHNLLLVIIIAICVFVLALLLYCIFRFRESSNPTPSKTTHHTVIEVIWTVVPVLILVVIAIPSFRLLYFSDVVPDADMTLNVTGRQWYWSYAYPDHGGFTFDSNMVPDDQLTEGQKRLLSVDNPVVVPVDTTVRVIISASDVLHSWAVPPFGLKTDAVPGRANETWFRAEAEGIYYGQCSELCGVNHGYMPIEVRVVSKDRFDAWLDQARQQFADGGSAGGMQVATAPGTAE